MARMAASVSAYAVRSTRFASGNIVMACCRKSTPVMPGIRWSERKSAMGSLRPETQRVERDELGRGHICIQCMKTVKPWGPCYEQGHEVAPIQDQPEFLCAN